MACSICLEVPKPAEQQVLSCGHVFHQKCVRQFRKHDLDVLKCPNCRAQQPDLKSAHMLIHESQARYAMAMTSADDHMAAQNSLHEALAIDATNPATLTGIGFLKLFSENDDFQAAERQLAVASAMQPDGAATFLLEQVQELRKAKEQLQHMEGGETLLGVINSVFGNLQSAIPSHEGCATNPNFPVGTLVRIDGLSKAVHLNGKTGVVSSEEMKNGRIQVNVDGNNKSIRPTNLFVVKVESLATMDAMACVHSESGELHHAQKLPTQDFDASEVRTACANSVATSEADVHPEKDPQMMLQIAVVESMDMFVENFTEAADGAFEQAPKDESGSAADSSSVGWSSSIITESSCGAVVFPATEARLSQLMPVLKKQPDRGLPSIGTVTHGGKRRAEDPNSGHPSCIICKKHVRGSCDMGKSCYKCHAGHDDKEVAKGGGGQRQRAARRKALRTPSPARFHPELTPDVSRA